MTANSAAKIAIFGHYGNHNLGDESIIEAMLYQMKLRLPDAEYFGMSINPAETAVRHQVDSFPIRRKRGERAVLISSEQALNGLAGEKELPAAGQQKHADEKTSSKSWKQSIKQIPMLGFVLRSGVALVDRSLAIKDELVFLFAARAYIKNIDLLIVTGSNQLLDNFGGAWGFPYTLLKWTLLAKSTGAKVAFVSVGAGPLKLPLSFRMLEIALKKADFVSYRDEGSRQLIESRIGGIDGKLFPDLAHSLDYKTEIKPESNDLTIAVNPMPVFDHRYWPIADEEKYRDYVEKIELLCSEILIQGHSLILFSTQRKDADVINDILEKLQNNSNYSSWQLKLSAINNDTVDGLMETIASSNLVVATRFHATVLPLQLGKPVLGICYYRKAAELLDEVGLEDYHVDIDDFSAQELLKKLNLLVENNTTLASKVSSRYQQYAQDLGVQYDLIVELAS